ncbi:thioesterase II family protein [Streptomyces sp. NPDC059165]|uniref:thioesterase II family protein n=1 Tax=Streptomyces sp. NPDC059165 TaxID=3346751 RepID=UPI0036C4D7BD
MSVRLFCLPYAGASAQMYRTWARELGPSVLVTPVELPGRGSRAGERPASELEPLLRDLSAFVLRMCDRPFALFGHGFGALLAYEIAARLERRYDRVAERLFVSGHGSPGHVQRGTPRSRLPPDAFLHQIRDLFASARRTIADPAATRRVLPVMRADFALAEAYRARPDDVLHCPIAVLAGRSDASTDRAALAGWRTYTRRYCRVRVFPGDHLFLHTAAAQLLTTLETDLSASIAGRNPTAQLAVAGGFPHGLINQAGGVAEV